MENKIRSTLNEIYFGKTRDIVNGLRSVQPLAEARKTKDLQVPYRYIFEAVFRNRLEPPLLGWLRSRFFCWSEPGAGAAFCMAAPAASFRQAKKKSIVLASNMTLRAV